MQYADYAVWQRKWMEGEILRKQGEYWERALAGAPSLLELPTDHPRPAEQEYAGGWVEVALEEELSRGLKELSKKHGTTLYMTLLAGWGALLARLSGQEDFVIGGPVANRGRMEIEGLIGFFVNMLALRLDVSGSPSVGELLKRVKEQTLAAQQHQDIPFEQVVEIARPVRNLAHTPLFQVIFTWQQNVGGGGLALPGLELGPLGSAAPAFTKFDLTLSLRDAGERIVGGLGYAAALFERSTVERYLEYLRELLKGMVAEETQAVDRLRILPEAEWRQLAYEWNATEAEYPREKLVHELFEEQAARRPGAVAVEFEGRQLSYGELNQQANRLAHHLRALGIEAETLVAICVERSIEMIVGILGILKAGGAYLPLDPDYPDERLAHMLLDSRTAIVLTQEKLLDKLATLVTADTRLVALDRRWSEIDDRVAGLKADNVQLQERVEPHHLAYVIYTSGSMGRPKGVMNEHRGVVNRLIWMQRAYGLDMEDAVLQKTPFSFDVSVWEFFWPLLAGARLVMARPEGHKDPDYLVDTIRRNRITTLHFVPPMLQVFLEHTEAAQCFSLTRVICSGEALPSMLVRRFAERLPHARLYNLYGPTEAAIDVTAWTCPTGEIPTIIPIGRPIANTQMYILDGNEAPVPIGVAGELHIGGVQVARGYLNRPDLTAERFVLDLFAAEAGARMYKTGDLARWRDDGTIEFLGRNDFQVKIRGFRIELGEIEARLMEHEGVREAVVVAREDTPGEKRLVGYVSARQGTELSVGKLREYLQQRLPEYMAPSAWVWLDSLPLTPNGKLDRKALPKPEEKREEGTGYVAPRTPVEDILAGIWARLLRMERVGIHDDFFELGGDSILSIQVVARAHQAGVKFAARDLFQRRTIAELAKVAQTAADSRLSQELVSGSVALTPIQRWFFEQDGADPHHFNQAVLLQARERLRPAPLAQTVRSLLAHHDALRLRFSPDTQGWSQRRGESC